MCLLDLIRNTKSVGICLNNQKASSCKSLMKEGVRMDLCVGMWGCWWSYHPALSKEAQRLSANVHGRQHFVMACTCLVADVSHTQKRNPGISTFPWAVWWMVSVSVYKDVVLGIAMILQIRFLVIVVTANKILNSFSARVPYLYAVSNLIFI